MIDAKKNHCESEFVSNCVQKYEFKLQHDGEELNK